MYRSLILAVIALLCSDIALASYGESTDSPFVLKTPLLNRTSGVYSPRELNEPCSTIKNMTKSQVVTMAAMGILNESQVDLKWFLDVTHNPSLIKAQADIERWKELKNKVVTYQFPEDIELKEVPEGDCPDHQNICSSGLESIFTSVFMSLVTALQQNDTNQEEEKKQFLKGFYGTKDDSE